MLIDDEIEITLTSNIIKYYKNIGYTGKYFDKIKVKIKDLPKSSNYHIKVKCDNCDEENNIVVSDYTRITNNHTEKYFCNKCATKIKLPLTNLKKYGCENPMQNEKIKNKLKCKFNIKYNVDFVFQIDGIKEKKKNTLLDKYGDENYVNLMKMKETLMKKYGVENCMQFKETFEKQQKSCFLLKRYKNLYYRGSYELDFLINFYNEIKIENSKSIKYEYDGKNKIYYPDFYLPDFNLIVEIKSNYIYKKDLNKNLSKCEFCLKQGYNFIFIIDKNYDKFLSIIK